MLDRLALVLLLLLLLLYCSRGLLQDVSNAPTNQVLPRSVLGALLRLRMLLNGRRAHERRYKPNNTNACSAAEA